MYGNNLSKTIQFKRKYLNAKFIYATTIFIVCYEGLNENPPRQSSDEVHKKLMQTKFRLPDIDGGMHYIYNPNNILFFKLIDIDKKGRISFTTRLMN
jgi:hypothetical protein